MSCKSEYVVFGVIACAITVSKKARLQTAAHTSLTDPHTSPASIPSCLFSMLMIETPVSDSPFKIACCIGAGPRNLGRREGWTFSLRVGEKWSRKREEMIRPKEAVISRLLWDAPSENGAGGCYMYIRMMRETSLDNLSPSNA